MYRKRPIVWPGGGLDTPKLASILLKYRKIKVLIAVVRLNYYIHNLHTDIDVY